MDRGTWWATVHGVTKSQTQYMHRPETGLWALYVFLLSTHMFQIQAYDLFYTWRHWCWGCLVSDRGWIQTHSTKFLSFWRKWPSKLSGGKVRKKSDISTKNPNICYISTELTETRRQVIVDVPFGTEKLLSGFLILEDKWPQDCKPRDVGSPSQGVLSPLPFLWQEEAGSTLC